MMAVGFGGFVCFSCCFFKCPSEVWCVALELPGGPRHEALHSSQIPGVLGLPAAQTLFVRRDVQIQVKNLKMLQSG